MISKVTWNSHQHYSSFGWYALGLCSFHENGNLLSEGEYDQAIPTGIWNYYREDGSKKEVLNHLHADTVKMISAWDENGNMTVKDGYGYYLGKVGGAPTEEGKVEDGFRVGEWISYHEMSIKTRHPNLYQPRMNGIYREFHVTIG